VATIEEIHGLSLSSAHFVVSENARRGQHVIESTVTAEGVAGVALVVLVTLVMFAATLVGLVALAVTVAVVEVAGDDACCQSRRALLEATGSVRGEGEGERYVPGIDGDAV
jgi:hypothetical protein